MTRIIAIQDLAAPTQELLAGIASGEELIIEQAGHPVARITSVPHDATPKKSPRPLGIWKGKIWTSPDFDAELPEEFWCPPDDPLCK